MTATRIVRRCAADNVPLGIHLYCWGCRQLVGPDHVLKRLGGFGLCTECRRALLELTRPTQPVRRPRVVAVEDGTVSTAEAAALAGMSVPHFRRLVRAGKIAPAIGSEPAGRSPHARRPRFRRADVARLTPDDQLINSDQLEN